MSLNEIKKQIHSISKTGQITRAMQLISTTKYNRIVTEAKNYQLYTMKVRQIVAQLVHAVGDLQHAIDAEIDTEGTIAVPDLLIHREIERIGVLVITSDQGLAGSYNSGLLKELQTHLSHYDREKIRIIAIGEPALRFAEKHGYEVVHSRTHLSSYPSFTEVQKVIRACVKLYRDGAFDQLMLCYNHAVSALEVAFQYHQLLPLAAEDFAADRFPDTGDHIEYTLEPSISEIAGELLPLFVQSQIYGAIIDAKAAEYSSRMQAMRQATDNANELIETLQQEYHQERQKRITNEIIEIINGANAQS